MTAVIQIDGEVKRLGHASYEKARCATSICTRYLLAKIKASVWVEIWTLYFRFNYYPVIHRYFHNHFKSSQLEFDLIRPYLTLR